MEILARGLPYRSVSTVGNARALLLTPHRGSGPTTVVRQPEPVKTTAHGFRHVLHASAPRLR